jgi:hypothetical protein
MKLSRVLLASSLLFSSLAVYPLAGAAGQFSATRGVFNGSGGLIEPKIYFPDAEYGDLYLATVLDGVTYYITPTTLVEEPEPFLADQEYLGAVPLPAWDSTGLIPGNYPLILYVVESDGDPLDVSNWVGGLTGIQYLQFKVVGTSGPDEDRNDDGWLDDDLNRDGYHDDDRDRDGYHDDDSDHDGYHDDDLDQDGYHDDDLDRDGYHDDDLDYDHYHDDDDDDRDHEDDDPDDDDHDDS